VAFEYASRSSKGARSYQEDAAFVHVGGERHAAPAAGQSAEALTAVLADGMGGHAGGALASSTACTTFLDAYAASTAASADDVPTRLDAALKLANAAIGECVAENPALDGMGCTLIGTMFVGAGVEWVSVGDSPLFLLRGDEIVPLNEDHSLAPEIDKLAAAGRMTWEDAKADPRRHFLRSALTGVDMELVDRSHKPLVLEPDDVVILASDGIHTLEERDILRVVKENLARGPEAVADGLIAAVEAVGDLYQDNTTVVVVRVTGTEGARTPGTH
jgi:protein phosphatase